jgi:hypothetical protein
LLSHLTITPKAWSYVSPGWSDERGSGRRATLDNKDKHATRNPNGVAP